MSDFRHYVLANANNPPHILDNFIEVYGTKHKHKHFLAMRFKRVIITYKTNKHVLVPIEPPNNSVVVIHGNSPRIQCNNQTFLLYTDPVLKEENHSGHFSIETLLKILFPKENIIFHFFKGEVLFLIANRNPFESIMQKCKRDVSFKTLTVLWEAFQTNRCLSYEEVSRFRFFKRNDDNLKHFNRWASFAFELGCYACMRVTGSTPSAYLGREIFSILKRSKKEPGPLPDPEFYECEIMYTNQEPVGIMYLFSDQKDSCVKHVSPMVVTEPRIFFRDSSSVTCNAWLPLYKNQRTWNEFGLAYYLRDVHNKMKHFKFILKWLQIQTSEKYETILMDLGQVANILLGQNYLNNLK